MSKKLIESFYQSFAELDAKGMNDCYHPEIVFVDPAFGRLKGERVKKMWTILCESQKGKDFNITYSDISFMNEGGKAHWEAWYTFSQTGRKVHNIIDAHFLFQDGKIIEHIDRFNLYRWSRQALGIQGTLLGWSGYFKSQLQKKTNHLLDKYKG